MAVKRFDGIEGREPARELPQQIFSGAAQARFGRGFGLWNRNQRVAVSVATDIIEGLDGRTRRAFIQFLGYVLRSATKAQAHRMWLWIEDPSIRRCLRGSLQGGHRQEPHPRIHQRCVFSQCYL